MSPQQAAEVAAEASRLAAAESRRGGRGRFAFGMLILRSLKQAHYSPRNVGHAGLASPRYCHFTSPIRRYPDLVVHRALLSGLGLDRTAPPAHELDQIAIETSAREREAMKLERDADDVCLAFLLERRLEQAGGGEPPAFDGEIVGVIAAGAFVRFGEEGFEGFLPARRLRDWYELNEEATALIGDDSGRALRIGDPVRVVVERVEAPRGRVDLSPGA
jgi:ribonuclease R